MCTWCHSASSSDRCVCLHLLWLCVPNASVGMLLKAACVVKGGRVMGKKKASMLKKQLGQGMLCDCAHTVPSLHRHNLRV